MLCTRCVRTALALVLLSAPGVRPASAQNEIIPNGFQLEPVIVDVFEPGRPVGFAEIPDGRFLIIERNTGFVRIHADGDSTAPIIHTVPNVSISGERGLLGITIDPAWPTRPYVYLYYTFSDSTAMPVVNEGHLTMFTATGDLMDPASSNLALTSPYDILTDAPDVLDIHNSGTLRFGPDGMLYVSLGDDGNACNAQDLAILAGAILRLDVSSLPGSGSGPPDKAVITPAGNPFSGPGENERLIWAWGLRNPFRFSIDPLTGDLFLGDVGLVTFEEIDVVPAAGPHGENFGWPHREGFIDPGLGKTCGAGNTFTDPALVYDHGPIAAVVCGPMYRGGTGPHAFPSSYEGRVFYHDIYKGWIRCMVDSAGTWIPAPAVPGQASFSDWVSGFAYLVDMQVGSDGALYVMRLVPVTGRPSGLYRIVPYLPLDAPQAAAVTAGAATEVESWPNPVRAGSGTRFWVIPPPAQPTELRIVDLAGRTVRTLSGGGVIDWDGTGTRGAPLPAGVYFYSLEPAEGDRPLATGRVVLLR